MTCRFSSACLLLVLLTPLPLLANPIEDFRFSGFASLGMGRISEENIRFADYESEWSFESDTILGLQAQTRLLDRLSVTGQVVAKGYSYGQSDDYQPEISWLFLSYEVAPELQVRLGRMRSPQYLYSETLDVGYTYVWIRPPTTVYTPLFEPFSNFDGADLRYSHELDWRFLSDATVEWQLMAGTAENNFQDIRIDADMLSLGVSLTQDPFKIRYSVMRTRADVSSQEFDLAASAFRQIGQFIPAFRGTEDFWGQQKENGSLYYHGLGLQLMLYPWTVTSEAFQVTTPDQGFGQSSKGWYFSLQHSIGRFTPFAVAGYYRAEVNEAGLQPLLDTYRTVPVGTTIPIVDEIRDSAVAAARGFNRRENAYTLGLRYEVMNNVALKGQWQYSRFTENTVGTYSSGATTRFPTESTLISFALDVVF